MSRGKLLLAAALMLTALSTGGSARAATWTALPSGTTETINAIDYRGPGAYWYGTSTGKLFKNGVQATGTTGTGAVNDIAMSPDGTVGLAAANGGRIMRSTDGGATWSQVAGGSITAYPNTNCSPGGAGAPAAVTENLTGVSWASGTVAYIVGPSNPGGKPTLLKSTNGGASWTDVNRRSTGNCLIDSGSGLTDVQALPGVATYFIGQYFGRTYVSFDDAATLVQKADAVNHYQGQPRIAVSGEQPDWIYAVDREDDGLSLNFEASSDSASNFRRFDHANGESNVPALYGVAASGQTMLAAGNGGSIYLSTDATTAYRVSDTGAFATTGWRAVSMASPTSAAVAGIGGVIATTTNANVIPDLTAPSGAINNPGTVTALTPTQLQATLTDNPGGSGIDPASITWSATKSGASPVTGTGNPTTVTFPIDGVWTVTVTFKDLAGNTATATRPVTVGKATAAKPAPTKTTTAKVPGATVKFAVPRACVAPGKTFTVTLSWKKQKKKGNKFVKITRTDFYIGKKRVKIDKKAPFKQRLTVKASTKPGSTIKLKARAFIKVKRGKAPKKSLNTSIKVCG
jgi:hypothetical protein